MRFAVKPILIFVILYAAPAICAVKNNNPPATPDSELHDKGDVQQPAEPPPREQEATPAEAVEPLPAVYETLLETLDILAAEGLFDPDDPKAVDQLMRNLVETFGAGVAYIPPAAANTEDSTPDTEPPDHDDQKSIQVVNETIGYLRPSNFEKGQNEKAEVFASLAADGGYKAVIIDLRSIEGTAFGDAGRLAEQLNKLAQPAVILVNSETSGAAELFVNHLQTRPKTLIMGQPTSGMPFKRREILLRNGGTLLVPDRTTPGAAEFWPPEPVNPDIVIDAMLDRKALETLDHMKVDLIRLGRDKTLRKAVDLLTVVKGLAHKHF